jgi:Secretion system C-terminal sorting domain
MKKFYSRYSHFMALFTVLISILYLTECQSNTKQAKVKEEENEPFIMESFDFWTASRSYPNTELVAKTFTSSYNKLHENMQMRAMQPDLVSTLPWQALAPMNFAGRILTMAVSPANANTIFVGSSSGGLWKTTTGGTGGPGGISWTYVPTGFPVLGVGAVVINPQNANEIYAGTGEVYNKNAKGVTAGGHMRTYRGFYGIGILKSIDGGASWQQVLNFSQSNLEGVFDMLINPLKPSTVWAATTDGLYRSFNSGTDWTRVHSVLMTTDLAMKPGDTSVLYVSCGNFGTTGNGLYKSVNAGAVTPVFTKMTSGLPANYTGMARMAISANNPNRVYATIGHDPGTSTKYGLYVSTNQGSSWAKATSTNIINGQGWYAHDVVADPANANIVYWGEIDMYKSTNGGSTFTKVSDWSKWNLSNTTVGTTTEGTSTNYVHADNHRIFYSGGAIYTCTDGGLFKSTNAGSSWLSLNGGLQTVQIYSNASVSKTDPNYMLLGLQDNGTFVYRGIPGCKRVIGADGFSTAIDPTNDNIGFAEYYFLNLKKSSDKGNTFPTTSYSNNYNSFTVPNENACFNSPFVFANNNTNIMYGGTIYLKKSSNKGGSWTNGNGGAVISGASNPIITLAAAPTDDNTLFISTSPGGGIRSKLFASTNGGTSVTNITSTLPDRYYTKIAVDPADKNRVAVTLSGFGSSHVFITHDGGSSWTDIGAGLPDVPHNTLAFDPNNTSILYVGNDLGVYFATDVPITSPGESATLNWTSYNEGFTDATLVSDILVTTTNKLRLATHGRGLWERDLAIAPAGTVQLSELQVVISGSQNMVSFKARHEDLVDYYELEFSKDGNRFAEAGKTTPSSRSAGVPNIYQLVHQDFNGAESGYYRIKIVLTNGQSYYSGMLKLTRSMDGKMKIYPNPVQDKLQLNLNANIAGMANISVMDFAGKIILNRGVSLQKGSNTTSLSLPHGNAGAYRIIVKGVVESNAGFIRLQ